MFFFFFYFQLQLLFRKNLEDELNRCKSDQLSAKLTYDTQERKLQDQLILKDRQIISIATNVQISFLYDGIFKQKKTICLFIVF